MLKMFKYKKSNKYPLLDPRMNYKNPNFTSQQR